MASNRKIYLQYPWKFPDSPYYKYLIEKTPRGFEYLNVSNQRGVITNKKHFWVSNFLKRNIRRFSEFLRLNIPNSHLSPPGDYDLIHCAHCLSKNKDKPWIADIEMLSSLAVSGISRKRGQNKVKKFLMKKNCKMVLPWTESTKNQMLKLFPEVKNKLEVVYPAIPVGEKKKMSDKKIRILYATRYFWIKGGVVALEVLNRLKKKYGEKIEITFISDIEPNKLQERYPLVKMNGLVGKEEMTRLYSESDIYFYPSFVDTFGFGILEAFSYGLPIVSVNTKKTLSRMELIEDRKMGFISQVSDELFEKIISSKEDLEFSGEVEDLTKKLFDNCCRLIENKNLREKLSNNCISEVREGKFSIKKRNEKLKRIYDSALH